jgi:hypothetical protein
MSDNNGSFGPQDTEQKVLVSQWERALDFAEYESDTELRAKTPSVTPDIVPRREADPSDYLRPQEKPLVQGAIIFGGLFFAAGAIFWWFGGDSGKPVTKAPSVEPSAIPTQASNQALSEAEAKLALQEQNRQVEKLAAEAKQAKTNPSAKPSPSASAKVPPVAVVKPKIVYKTTPQPKPSPVVVAKAPTSPLPSPQSFIPIGNAQQVQRPERRGRPQRQPLVASEKAFLDSLKPKVKAAPAAPVGDPLIAGQTISVHLMSTVQFTNQGQKDQTAMQVMTDQPLRTSSGGQIPRGSILLFQASVNPQNGSINAISGDAIYNGKTIRIQKGAMSLEVTNKERTTRSPLVAQSVNLREGELATADRNNALLGIASGIGDELTKGSSSVTVGNGSTIINQGNNVPNIWGGALKGASQSVLTDQRQRTQTKASQILSAPPAQSLRGDIPLLLTVTFPAPISIVR